MRNQVRFIRLKLDIIFKKMFGDEKNVDTLKSFLSAALNIPEESISRITLKNTELLPDTYGKKFSILDLKMYVDDKLVNVEMQVAPNSAYPKRSLFYCSKLYSDSLDAGEDYEKIPKVICINIIDFDLYDTEDYHSHFAVMETTRHELLDGTFDIHFFELKKINKNIDKNDKMKLWLQLINAESEDDLVMLENTGVVGIQNAVTILREMNADEKLREQAYYREKQLHDEVSFIESAKRTGFSIGEKKGRKEGIAIGEKKGRNERNKEFIVNMRAMGMSEEVIMLATNLTSEQIAKLMED